MATTTTPPTTGRLSFAAFEQLPDDGMHHEIIEGVLISLPPPKLGHGAIAHRIFRAFESRATQDGFTAWIEMGYKLSDDPATWIQPDVSLVDKKRVASADPEGYLLGAPELAVEIISPSESAHDVSTKVDLLLKHGSKAVWVIYSRLHKVEVHLPNQTAFTRRPGDNLSLPDLLPGWELPVDKLFK